MRHWTRAQLNGRYEELRVRWAIHMVARPTTDSRQVENFRSLAAVELLLADVVEAAAEREDSTFLEFQALHQAARYRRSEAVYWRSEADRIAASAGSA